MRLALFIAVALTLPALAGEWKEPRDRQNPEAERGASQNIGSRAENGKALRPVPTSDAKHLSLPLGSAETPGFEITAGEPPAPVTRCAYTPDVLARPRLRGVMSPGGNMTEDDFRTLADWGATLLRFQMVRDWHGVDGNQDLDEYDRWLEGRLDHFDTVVLPLGRKYGIMVVLDLHVPPGGYDAAHEMNMFHDRKYADHFVEIWHRIAKRFKGREGIYGYDLVNEPLQSGEAAPGCDFPTLMRRAV